MNEYTPTTNEIAVAATQHKRAFFPKQFNRWLRGVLADAWDEGFAEPRECCGLCPLRSCPWDNGGNGPTNPYREEN